MGYYWIILLLPTFFGSSHGDCGAPPRLDFGALDINLIDQVNFSVGAVVTYSCRPGYVRAPGTKNVTTCLNDSTWSTPETFCNRRSCGYPGDTLNGEVSLTDTLFGSIANYTCNVGYKMISRRSFRECRADGSWSNEVPQCSVQICPPPDAITDGKFSPDKEEYQYQDAVVYECNDKTSALIGEKSLYCTAAGEWSSDPPQCKAVDCSTPNVDNAIKVSGFTGPYGLNSAVRFECLQGYTMVGEPSVKCNASSKWEPSLPTCKKIVTQSPTTTTKEKETETGGIVTQSPTTTTKEKETETGEIVTQSPTTTTKEKETETGGIVTQSPTTTKEKETETGGIVTQSPTTTKKATETGAGNNVGVIVGNTLIIITMSVMALVVKNGF